MAIHGRRDKEASSERGTHESATGESQGIGLATFWFALAALSVQVLVNSETAGATLYAILVAAIGETIAGMWAIARGNTYVSGILSTFGIWLFGFYMTLTQGVELGVVYPDPRAPTCCSASSPSSTCPTRRQPKKDPRLRRPLPEILGE